ncbi:hypothetical protein HP570_25795 [Brevibacillus sp. RS1.1]|uniref:hypothetical protein n=1 Tax=Brevibacillus sp. RS1.1 TaxID=2738982 RepID=UPI00156B777A|nr:hypothetical protein [Brevibacillus sp. RS1.1]NRR05630.1 hypothetical protein [Brevibacillus sp. RS1.1]
MKIIIQLSREQAIFFETMLDLNYEFELELLILAYHDFSRLDFSLLSDKDVHSRAKHLIKHYEALGKGVDLYDTRWAILEKLDLDDAEWEYLDLDEEKGVFI